MATTALELTGLHTIANFRTPLLDDFFKAWNWVDTEYFFLLFIPTVWVLAGRKWGIRLLLVLVLSSFTNNYLKSIFQHPRPFHVDPSLLLVQVGGYSFPSGAAQTSVILAGFWYFSAPSLMRFFSGAAFGSMLSFSRLYLGVHFPSDILFGWVVGAGLVGGLFAIASPIERLLTKHLSSVRYLLVFLILALIPLAEVSLHHKALFFIFMLIGAFSGVLFIPFPEGKKTWSFLFIQLGITLGGVVFLAQLWSEYQNPWIGYAMGLWLSLGGLIVNYSQVALRRSSLLNKA